MNATWMQSPNVRLVMYVAIGIMPSIIADVAAQHVGWLSALTVVSSGLLMAKAFMTNPVAGPLPPASPPRDPMLPL